MNERTKTAAAMLFSAFGILGTNGCSVASQKPSENFVTISIPEPEIDNQNIKKGSEEKTPIQKTSEQVINHLKACIKVSGQETTDCRWENFNSWVCHGAGMKNLAFKYMDNDPECERCISMSMNLKLGQPVNCDICYAAIKKTHPEEIDALDSCFTPLENCLRNFVEKNSISCVNSDQ